MNRPVPYATYQSKNELPALSKNKDIQKFQEDVVEMINPKSNQKLQDKLLSKDQKLNILLEKNLEDLLILLYFGIIKIRKKINYIEIN